MSISTVTGLCTVTGLVLALIKLVKKFDDSKYKFITQLFFLSIVILIVPFSLNQFFYKFNVYAPYAHIKEYLFADYIVIWALNILFILSSDVKKDKFKIFDYMLVNILFSFELDNLALPIVLGVVYFFLKCIEMCIITAMEDNESNVYLENDIKIFLKIMIHCYYLILIISMTSHQLKVSFLVLYLFLVILLYSIEYVSGVKSEYIIMAFLIPILIYLLRLANTKEIIINLILGIGINIFSAKAFKFSIDIWDKLYVFFKSI